MITTNEVLEDMAFFDDWESRYSYIIDLGRDLPKMQAQHHTEDRLIKGCQSNVWLETERIGNKLHFIVDSDAHIVRGLLTLVLAAYDDKTAQEISEFDIDSYFQQLDLENHLSPTRGNGLRSIVGRIRTIAAAELANAYLT